MAEYSTYEVESYLIKAGEKLKASKLLLDNEMYSDSVSRSYYAMYNSAKAALLLKDSSPRTHKGLLSEFGLRYIKEGIVDESHARALTVALEDRGEADYGSLEDFTEEEARQVYKDATAFIKAIEKVIKNMTEGK